MIFQESESVELKAIVVEDIKKEIIAFANCEGGKLYIGIQDDGTVLGLDNPDEGCPAGQQYGPGCNQAGSDDVPAL